jgi:hypothetical protein
MPLVAWPHCSCPPDPVRDPSNRSPACYPPRPSIEGPGKVTIQFSASKARVEIARRIGRPLAGTSESSFDATLITHRIVKEPHGSAPDRLAPEGLSRPEASRPWPGTSPSPSVAIAGRRFRRPAMFRYCSDATCNGNPRRQVFSRVWRRRGSNP